MLPPLLKATFSNPGFPPGFYEISAQGGLWPCLVLGLCSPPEPLLFLMPVKKTLVNEL